MAKQPLSSLRFGGRAVLQSRHWMRRGGLHCGHMACQWPTSGVVVPQ